MKIEDLGKRVLHTTSASILASITVEGAYFAAYPYISAKAAWISSDSSILPLSEKNDRILQQSNLHNAYNTLDAVPRK